MSTYAEGKMTRDRALDLRHTLYPMTVAPGVERIQAEKVRSGWAVQITIRPDLSGGKRGIPVEVVRVTSWLKEEGYDFHELEAWANKWVVTVNN